MICFLVCRGYGFTVRPLEVEAQAPEINVIPYNRAFLTTRLPKATYIFVDLDRLSRSDLVAAGRLYRRLAANGCRVLNDPTRVLTRFPLLRTLYLNGINPFNVYSLAETGEPEHFPVFIRVGDDHAGPLTDLISDQETLDRAIEALVEIGYPRTALIAVEYAAQPARPGIFRKLSVFRVADQCLPHVCVHDHNWAIKAGRSGVASSELYDEELKIMRTNPFAEFMKKVFEIAGIDFGRVDFSIVDGRPCIYEINTNPALSRPYPHPVPQRVTSMTLWWEGFVSALHAIDEQDKDGSQIDVSLDHPATLGRALDIYPSVKNGFLNLCEAFSRHSDGIGAMRSAKVALAHAPDDTGIAIRVSKLMAENDHLQDAIDIAIRRMEGDPENFELLLHSARLLARANRGTDAVETAERAVCLRPRDMRAHRVVSEVHWTLGNSKAALIATKDAIELICEKSDTSTSKQLAELYAQRSTLQNEVIRQRVRKILRPFLRGKR